MGRADVDGGHAINRNIEPLNNMQKNTSSKIVVGVTLSGPSSMSTHEQILAFLDRLPEHYGSITLQDARVLKGMTDEDDCSVDAPKQSLKAYGLTA